MRRPALICVPLCALAISACATTASTSNFHGTEHSVAQTVANLQADVTSGEQKKICTNDLAAAVVSKLGGRKGCEAAVKTQLGEIDSTEVTVESVQVTGTTATAKVRSVERGKKREGKVELRKEGDKWKISALP
jgi:hypothetical protein